MRPVEEILLRLDRIIERLDLIAARLEPPVPVERPDPVQEVASAQTAADLNRFKVKR